jgi:alkaline phosphatase D
MILRSKTQPTAADRRRFLDASLKGVGASLSLALVPGHELFAAPRVGSNPFTLGVASGDPTPDGIVLWTRLAPDPTNDKALGQRAIPVRWRIARDAAMRQVVAGGYAVATPDLAHSVHVEATGLQPARDHFYQFSVRDEESTIGHFRTAPAHNELLRQMRLAFVTCQDWRAGFFTPYRDLLSQDLDLVLHLGDYVYEYPHDYTWREGVPVPVGFEEETIDLRTYRLRHALYKLDADLQAAHAKFPFSVIWDDHEVQNDYSGKAPEYGEPSPEFRARRMAAYQAWYEHMPIRLDFGGANHPSLQIYRRLRYGALADINLLDTRQYRTDNPCGDGESFRCDAALTGRYTMLGHRQENWLSDQMTRSTAQWNVIAQGVLMAQLEHRTTAPNWFWNDAWDGYPLARQRLLQNIVDTRVRNPLVLTGDWHSTFVNHLTLDFADVNAPAVATEFVTPAINSGGDGTPYGPYYGPMIPYNPHIKYYEGDRRGCFTATLTNKRAQFDLRFVTNVQSPNGTGYAQNSWLVLDGKPGAVAI